MRIRPPSRCHPAREGVAHGLCRGCYTRWYRLAQTDPEAAARLLGDGSASYTPMVPEPVERADDAEPGIVEVRGVERRVIEFIPTGCLKCGGRVVREGVWLLCFMCGWDSYLLVPAHRPIGNGFAVSSAVNGTNGATRG